MSISSALSNALSGLTVSSRAADIVSSNIANAMTDGYGVRSLNISARAFGDMGAGAFVTGVTRSEDAVLIGQRRLTEAELAFRNAQGGYLTRLEALIGTPDMAGSLAARSAGFEAALASAAANPQAQVRLAGAVDAATALAGTLNTISDGIQAERLRAEGGIATAVARINGALDQLATLNTRIRQDTSGGRDVSALLDAQAQIVNDIAPLIPLHSRRDQMGALQLFSADGQPLLDGRPAVLSFTPVTVMEADMTRDSGALSGLALNGRALAMSGAQPALGGGHLSALFALRDDWGVGAQASVDAVARDLAGRFDAAGLDPTLAPGQPGLFTDAGAVADSANEVGLASRLRVNAAVRPEEGGALWRLRDGLGASTEGPVGHASFLQAQRDALGARDLTVSGGFSATARSFAGLVADHLSGVGMARQSAETMQSHTAARFGALRQEELAQGVDTDAEMQRLLQIEQMFAANARVVSAAQEMIDQLIRMGR
ncbi:flagellar hook-associated protein FlgK [Roseicyclus mahoneyensis]|uniref:Flagellar hook-associated protein 1 n=1 Tax=Roseicyclus mahoneyensis TaxID=164332 RepID=A0A316GFU3_9RHOB|nr:flagellar hook-associated protein FlgK [Roseicyclus mahoneyensis]PWK59820.1 flagellar hook-associated protein 1 FlgK [Roseicyclus mahoneyensis]